MRVGAAALGFGIAALAACGEPREFASPGGGSVAAGGECASCHSAPAEAPPFRSTRGQPGAHDLHLAGEISPPLACAECHTVPAERDAPGHLVDSPQDVVFSDLARTGGASPTFDGLGCTASYCHGSFPGGNAQNRPLWLSPRRNDCGTCHGLPPDTGQHLVHVTAAEPVSCQACHGAVNNRAVHVNGVKDVPLGAWNPVLRSCAQACHSPRSWDE